MTDGVLPGITRSCVIQWAKQHNILCREISFGKAIIAEADAVFLSSVLDEMIFLTNHPIIEDLKASLHA
ncbi:aminotransferase class IV [Legionella sp.]|uniref:aminotransferase class IV n=1 Tax=Legionella sp. TaxID=459 RepID=UPI0039E59429